MAERIPRTGRRSTHDVGARTLDRWWLTSAMIRRALERSRPRRGPGHRRAVAQLVAHRSPKPAVVGSSPACPATTRPSGRVPRPAERGTRTHVGTNCERIRTGGRRRRPPVRIRSQLVPTCVRVPRSAGRCTRPDGRVVAGQAGLEPTTAGFGDRCATNCATALRWPGPRRGRDLSRARRIMADVNHQRSSVRAPTSWVERRPGREKAHDHRDDLCQYGPVRQPSLPPGRPRIATRIAAIAESATLAVDAKAKQLMAAGRPVIGFGAGEPDFPTPQYIVDAAVAACAEPAMHHYTPAAGLPALRQAIADKTLRDSGYPVAANQVLVTNGGKQAVYEAFATVVDDGDEVLLPAPYWTTYPECIRLAG